VTEETIAGVEKTVQRIIHHIQEKKGEDIVSIDLRGITSVADFFILATGSSGVHVRAIADEVRDKLKQEHDIQPWHIEGFEAQKWVLIDYVDVVVHVFDDETRKYYRLENLWKDAKITYIDNDV
jgi:ribosome-associated protein